MQKEPGYRTPVPVLRRFAGSDVELVLGGMNGSAGDACACEAGDLSLAATAWIGARFRGDRDAAEDAATRAVAGALGVKGWHRWPESERSAFRALALIFAQIPGLARWPAADKRALVALMRAKGRDEFRFHALLKRPRRLRTALAALAAQQRGRGD
jgi:hypothetical protein